MARLHWVLTLQWPTTQGPRVVTQSDVLEPPPEATRSDVFKHVYDLITNQLGVQGAPVMFWSCEVEALNTEPVR